MSEHSAGADYRRSPFQSLTFHLAVLAGGAVGASISLAVVGFWLVPGVYQLSTINGNALICPGFGAAVGYLPGLAVGLEVTKRVRLIGFLVAATISMLICGPIAAVLAIGAYV